MTVFGFSYSRNYGLFFGFIGNRGSLSLIFGAISILAVVIFLRKRDTFRVWSGAFFLSGALGNYFTKLFLGYVIDFLPGGFMGHFFNLADIYLFLGLIGIVISEMRRAT